MALQKFECTRCDKSFSAPNFTCADGKRHQVELKVYFAPMNSLRTYVSEERSETLGDGRKRLIPAKLVEFAAGRYQTSDPEEQLALDAKVADGTLISEAQWKRIHFKPEDILKEENKALRERLAKYENPLLEQVKADTAGQKAQ
jgi:hypothetical protein